MRVYAVFRRGVYWHGCCGVFEPLDEAVRAADYAADVDSDEWHNYEVVPLKLGEASRFDFNNRIGKCGPGSSPGIHEPPPVYVTRKGDTERARKRQEATRGLA